MQGRSVILALGAAVAALTFTVDLAAGVTQPPPLQLGSRGAQVRALQQRLTALGYLPPGTADGVFGMRTWHAVVAFQGWQRLQRDGVVGARTRVVLASATRPQPWVKLRRGLELDLQRQVLLVVAGGRTTRVVHISSGAPGYTTPRGRFHVYRRERMSWSKPYRVWMPYALYFTGGVAVHGFGSVPAYPASHSCVRMPLTEAPFVYAAAPLGTPVVIR
jgi:peptidoglycan hydrolase-like protein with peptidoglycan-binding domain